MRNKKKKIGLCIIFIVIIIGIYCIITPIFKEKSVEGLSEEYKTFGKDKFETIFVGSSVMFNAVYPLELYKQYGMASFNLGCGAQRMSSSYYIVKQAIREQHPKLIVLDVYLAGIGKDYPQEPAGFTHYVTDALHYPEKLEMINDVLPVNRRLDYIYEMGAYHERWENITKDDFEKIPSGRKGTYGAKVHYYSSPFESFGDVTSEKKELPKETEKYLRKIIELCQENHTEILLTLMPLDYSAQVTDINRSEWQGYWNKVQDIANEYGIRYLNFMYHYDELDLDKEKDTDGGTHLNGWGADKLTSYLGNYIKQNYKLKDVRSDPKYDFMKKDVVKFEKYKKELELASLSDFSEYLDALVKLKNEYADEYDVCFSVRDIQGYFLDDNIIKKMKKIGFINSEILLEKEYHSFIGITGGTENIEKYGGDEAISCDFYTKNKKKIAISSQTLNSGNNSIVQIGGENYSKNMRGFNIVVFDAKSEKVIDSVNFDTHVPEFTCTR